MDFDIWQILITQSPGLFVAVVALVMFIRWNEQQNKREAERDDTDRKEAARRDQVWGDMIGQIKAQGEREKEFSVRQVSFLEARITNLENKLTAKENEYVKLKSEKDTEIADLKKATDSKIAELEAEIKQLRQQLRESTSQATNMGDLVKELTEVNRLLTVERDDFKKRLEAVEQHQRGDTDNLNPAKVEDKEADDKAKAA